MKINEFGKGNSRTLMLIPGNFSCWRQFKELIPMLSDRYHILAVSLDGYDETGKTEFTPFEVQAKKLIRFIRNNYDGHIDLLLGESIGSGPAIYMAHSDEIDIGTTVLSGPECLDFGIFNPLLASIFASGQKKTVEKVSSEGLALPGYAMKMMGLSKEKISQMNVVANGIAKGITEKSIVRSDWEGMNCYRKLAAMSPKPSANVVCWYGEKEGNIKKAVKELQRLFPSMTVKKFKGYGHGELLMHPDVMAEEIEKLMCGEADA